MFAAANAGRALRSDPQLRDRYLDPDYRRALDAIAAADTAARVRRDADEARRGAVACRNSRRLTIGPWLSCGCVYCGPDLHLAVAADVAANGAWPLCLCGRQLEAGTQRCADHDQVDVVVLDGDPPALLALRQPHRPQTEHAKELT